MKSILVAFCLFMTGLMAQAAPYALNPKILSELRQAENTALSDPLGSRHLAFAYATITAPVGYANILMNIARDPDVRTVIEEAAPDMQKSVRDTWVTLMASAALIEDGQHPKLQWLKDGFNNILQKGFFPSVALENSQLFMQMGEPNAYTWTFGPHAPMVNVYDALLEKMPRDAVIAVLGHELGHNQGLHLWAQTIWTAVADKFGRVLIPNPDSKPGDIFTGIPATVAAKFTDEQKSALNRYFSGMSRADLDAKLDERLDGMIAAMRDDRASRTGSVENHDAYSPQEQRIRSELAASIQKIGDRLYESKGRDGFLTWAAQMAADSANVEKIELSLNDGAQDSKSASVQIDKKVAAWATRQQELHADLLGLINAYQVFGHDLDRAIKAAAAADAGLAGGKDVDVDAMIKQSRKFAELLRVSPADESLYYKHFYEGRESHPASVVRAGMYEQFAQSPAFKIVTDPFNRSLWAYSEFVRALNAETSAKSSSAEAIYQSEWAQGMDHLKNIIAAYEKPLFEAFKDEAVVISTGEKSATGSLYSRLFDFIDLYRQAQAADSYKTWGRWDYNVSGLIGGKASFLARLRHELQTMAKDKDAAVAQKLMGIDSMLARAGVSMPEQGLRQVFEDLMAHGGVAAVPGTQPLPGSGLAGKDFGSPSSCGMVLVTPKSPFNI